MKAKAFIACLLLYGCGDPCVVIRQQVVVPTPDPALASLSNRCLRNEGPAPASCGLTSSSRITPSSCACLALCERMLELIDGFPGRESLRACYVQSPRLSSNTGTDAGLAIDDGSVFVSVDYKPSNCDSPAR